MTPYSQRFTFRLLGISRELECFATEAEQRTAYQVVSLRVQNAKYGKVRVFLVLIAVSICVKLLARPVGAAVGLTALMPAWLYEGLSYLVVTLFFTNGMLWFSRSQYSRAMREHLVERGIPTCLHCGYNLTGAVEPRCPECGAAMKSVDN